MTLKYPILAASVLALSACASSTPYYGPATSANSYGYAETPIEQGRYRVTYTADDPQEARDLALLRAAELTLSKGGDWFQVVHSSTDRTGGGSASRGGPSVSIGGSAGSGGYSGVGVGVGFGIPIGGSSAAKITQSMEILVGSGPKPQGADVYDAGDVQFNLSGRY